MPSKGENKEEEPKAKQQQQQAVHREITEAQFIVLMLIELVNSPATKNPKNLHPLLDFDLEFLLQPPPTITITISACFQENTFTDGLTDLTDLTDPSN